MYQIKADVFAMNDLMAFAIQAHGGLERWQAVDKLFVEAKITGEVWARKGQANALERVRIKSDAHRQHVEYYPFGGPGRRSIYDADRVAIATDDGRMLETRDSPRTAFAGHSLRTPWDELHLAYFSGYAMWTYLTTPFLFAQPGFQAEEIAPWQEDNEEWRCLRVTFPDDVQSHCKIQTFYFGPDGVLRRQDYHADIMGGHPVAHYASEPRNFAGLIYPTKRRAFTCGPDNRPLDVPAGVSIDFLDIVPD